MAEAPPDKNAEVTRDARGRWLKGVKQKAGPGRPPIPFSVTAIIRARVEQRPDVINKLFEAADNGEPWAIQYIIDRIEGKPRQAIEQSGELIHKTETVYVEAPRPQLKVVNDS